MIVKAVSQDGQDFTLDVPVNLQNDQVYGRGKKSDVPDKNLFVSTNKMSRKVITCFLQLKNLLSVMTGYLSKIVLHHIDQIWHKISLKKL